MRRAWPLALVLAAVSAGVPANLAADQATVRVVDAVTRAPIADAIVTVGGREVRTDARGLFQLDGPAVGVVGVRAYGYQRRDAPVKALRAPEAEVSLDPFRPKALYLSVFGVGNSGLRTAALQLAATTEVNALVVDIKGDRGLIAYRSSNPVAERVGAQNVVTIKDLRALAMSLHERGIYSIARIVVFKDDLLAKGRPELAVRKKDGSIFRDREGLAWTDPESRDAWDYNIAVAVDAARAGFDEIQFDYVRLPDAPHLSSLAAGTAASREAAIDGFLTQARGVLRPFNVFLAADIFGYVCWNADDTGIGQRIENLLQTVDYLSPMLYPSSFQFGIPGYRNPVAHPYEIVRLSLDEALRRTGVPAMRFRPWLQAFPDYAFGGGTFRNGEVRTQIKAAEDAGASGWMLWNPRNIYSAADLRQ